MNIDPERKRLALAVGLYILEEISIGKACEISGKDRVDFIRILGENDIPCFRYSIEEIDKDLDTLRKMDSPE